MDGNASFGNTMHGDPFSSLKVNSFFPELDLMTLAVFKID